MANIKKIKSIYFNDSCNTSKYDISIEDSLGNDFIMFFGGNLDLYWIAQNYKTRFVIDKQDIDLYKIFDSLYLNLKEIDSLDENRLFCTSNKNFDGNQFFWYSEDAPIENANKLIITPEENSYIINFENNEYQYKPRRTNIRFTTSGSRNHLVVNEFIKLRNYLLETIPENILHETSNSALTL